MFAAILATSLGLFAGGVAMGAYLHLAACPLCIIQRMVYLLVASGAIAGLVFHHRTARLLSAGAMLAFSGLGMFVAGYQSYLQRFPKGIGCAADSPWWERSVFWAGEKLPLFFGAGGVCEDASWKLFGLSIAELSLLAFFVLALASLMTLIRRA